jgi:hypothetical protein
VVTLLRLGQRIASLGLILIAVASVTSAAALTIMPQLGEVITATESTSAELELDVLAQRSTMYASDGSFMTLLVGEQNRESITLDEMPQEVISSILAMEDNDFYEHDGVNYRAVFRALAENISAGGIEQGGSTITQQLVKNALLNSDQSFDRKKTEAFYALRLEEQFTKDEILERYLNTVYFGQGAYGLKGAAEVYFGLEDPMDMGWEEAALLAGLIRSPNSTNPVTNPQRARDRRATVVERLLDLELITETQARRINRTEVPEERSTPLSTKPSDYFERFHVDPMCALRCINYPEQTRSLLPDQRGAGEHSDYGSITILKSDPDVPGLEIRLPDGQWAKAPLVDDAFIVNIGDMLARWTNDRWVSTLHRVSQATDVDGLARQRQSLAFFHNTSFNAEIRCIPTCLAEGQRSRYEPVLAGSYLQQRFSSAIN